MTGRKLLVLAVIAAFAAVPALAGDSAECELSKKQAAVAKAGYKGKKCTASTQECLDHMAAKMRDGGFVGVELEPDTATGTYQVVRVVPGSPAESAGIQSGDVLFALNGVKLSEDNHEALKAAKKDWKAGQEVTYTIKRNGADRKVNLTLAPMPADVLAKWIGQHMLEHSTVDIAQN